MAKSPGGDVKYVPFPKIGKKLDEAKLKEMYLSSKAIAWTDFCKEHEFNHNVHAPILITELKRQKLDAIQKAHEEELHDLVFVRKQEFERHVVDAIKELPALSTTATNVIHKYWQVMANAILENELYLKGKTDKKPLSKMPSPMDISFMARATKDVVEARHKALLMNADSIKLILEVKANGEIGAQITSVETNFGDKKVTQEQAAEILMSYYDKKPRQVENLEEGGGEGE